MAEENESYNFVKQLAIEKRELYGIKTGDVTLSKLRQIYKKENIKIDYNCGKIRNLRAAYYNDENGCSILLNKKLPKPAKIFSLTHELKHHYLDKNVLEGGIWCRLKYENKPIIEKTAEVFAAEFIWPESEFVPMATSFGLPIQCSPKQIVNFKRKLTIPISYQFLCKRLEWFGFISKGQYNDIKFQKLERDLYGIPFYLRKSNY